jgi:CheY-like chemotaxis protein/HPt (histidine-containing phosphotransfer) domain-containing protein
LRVLVVEDNAVNQAVVARQLEALGFAATIVEDARRGLEALAREPFNAVLLDCELPGMDGYTAAQEIRRREGDARHTAVIALTAHATAGQRERCLAAGMDDFLSKPVRLATLADAIDRWTGAKHGDQPVSTSDAVGARSASRDPGGIDLQALADIAELSKGGGQITVHQLVETFLADLDDRLEAIRRAADARDVRNLADLVHPLASSAAALGARGFAALCAEVEARARNNEAAQALALAKDLLVAADDLPGQLRRAVGAAAKVA